MKELKCPKCGTAITIDEADYAAILSQVRSSEFEAEIRRREAEMEAMYKARSEAEMARRLSEQSGEMGKRDAEIVKLREQLTSIAVAKDLEMQRAVAERDARIVELNAGIANVDNAIKMAVMQEQARVLEEQSRTMEQLRAKDMEIERLSGEIKNEKNEAIIRENSMRETHKSQLQAKQQEVEFYRDLKSRLSTKMIGETLEEHCYTEFERLLRPHMPYAYFEKDNTVVDGTKGDFVYRDFDGDLEYISIMFEMKNEADDTAKKHKNADFFKKLDEDRKKKNCEYAILVSMLEPESELYNAGIVDVSHLYDKMYVIRPQFFVPIITLLTQAAKRSIEYQRELAISRSQTVDITNFEAKLADFQSDFNRNVTLAHSQYEAAIKAIEASIKDLEKVRDNLKSSGRNLRIANDKAMDLTIRSLTYMNPTMQQMFAEERRARKEREKEEM